MSALVTIFLMETDLPQWAALLISAMLMAPFLVALLIFLRHQWRVRTWTHAEAVVTERRSATSRQGDGSTTTTTTVTYTFVDAAEQDRTGTAVNPAAEPRYGDPLEVMYHPGNPDQSVVVALGGRYVVMLGVFALLFALGVWSVFVPLT